VVAVNEDWLRVAPSRAQIRSDALVAVALLIGTTVSALLYSRIGYYDDPAPLWLSAIVIVAHTLPLALRRLYPATVAVVVSVAFFVGQQFSVPEMLFANITLFSAIYSVGAWGRDRRRAAWVRLAIIVGMFVWIGVNLIISTNNPDYAPDVPRAGVFSAFASLAIIQVLTNLLYFGGAYYFGDAAWRSARERSQLEARTAELERERERSTRQAVALDRLRIARELHDVVAHHVSVMGVQAGAARRVLATDPATALASLETVEQNARAAVDELHHLLSTLRQGETDAATDASSTRGLEQLDDLVAESCATGIPTTLVVVGEPRPVSRLAGFTVYRVAQEALTNVRKHAGSGVRAELRLRYLEQALEIEVTDDGVGHGLRHVDGGLGIVGMRERVTAVGGTLHAGPRSGGGFLVRASMPEVAR
jgi:signal transduction histidine kinase